MNHEVPEYIIDSRWPRYRIYADGRIFSLSHKKFIKPEMGNAGYLFIRLTNTEGKRIARNVHRILAAVFIPNPDNKPYVNHNDLNKQNNNVKNLKWMTRSENCIHAGEMGAHVNKDKKAALRMSLIGKEFSKQNSESLRRIAIKKRKPVIQLSLDNQFIKSFVSYRAAELETGINGIWNVLSGKYKQANGFKWVYLENYKSA